MPWPRQSIGTRESLPGLKAHLERDLESLEAFLDQLEPAVGGLSYNGAAVPLTATTTPQRITAFDTVRPITGPIGVEADPVADTLQARRPGIYRIDAQITAEISSGTAYTVEAYVDGVATGIRSAVDSSNQTDGIFLSLVGMRAASARDSVLELRVSTDSGSGAFNIVNAEFFVTRIATTRGIE